MVAVSRRAAPKHYAAKLPEAPVGRLRTHGYVVLRGALRQPGAMLSRASALLKAHAARPIFNHNGMHAKNDGRRLQVSASLSRGRRGELLHLLEAALATESLPTSGLCISPGVFIHSRPGCQAQAAHTDWEPAPGAPTAYGVLGALEHRTTLDVWPGTHVASFHGDAADGSPQVYERMSVHLSPGDLVVFSSDLVHAGSAYSVPNTRLHVYADHVARPRVKNRTYDVAPKNCRILTQ